MQNFPERSSIVGVTMMHAKGFPTIQIGKRMVVPKNKLIEWMEEQTSS